MTGGDLVASAMRLIGALGSGETPTAAEAADGLSCLNDMLDSWRAERIMAFTTNIEEFTLTAGKQIYTYGPGGDFDTIRPAAIDAVSIVSLNNPAQPLELSIANYSDDEWQDLPVKTGISSPLAQGIFDDGNYPLRSITFWPVPSVQTKVRFYVWEVLDDVPDLVTDISFPPGYKEAVRYNLASRLIAEMPGEYAQVTIQVLAGLAVESLARVKSMNLPTIEATIEDIPGCGGGHYNYYSDSTTGRR